jgi:hypothetical protein
VQGIAEKSLAEKRVKLSRLEKEGKMPTDPPPRLSNRPPQALVVEPVQREDASTKVDNPRRRGGFLLRAWRGLFRS